jgi:hypothetical protein
MTISISLWIGSMRPPIAGPILQVGMFNNRVVTSAFVRLSPVEQKFWMVRI